MFFSSAENAVGAEHLESLTRLSKELLQSEIEDLRSLGYQIELVPHIGYRLFESPDILIADEIRARLPDNIFGERLTVFRETSSTNDLLLRHAANGQPEGTSVCAEAQTHGRGRLGRHWESSPSLGLWCSFLFRPAWKAGDVYRLTLIAAAALHRAISHTFNLSPRIKWPNDILLEGKKLAGILCESAHTGTQLNHAIVGIGCNVNHRPEDFSPSIREFSTSLRQHTCHPIRRADLLVSLMRELQAFYHAPWSTTLETWKKECLNLGQRLTLDQGDSKIHGSMIDLGPLGELIIRTDDGKTITVNSGDLTFHTPKKRP